MRQIITYLCLTLCISYCFAQTDLDSLAANLNSNTPKPIANFQPAPIDESQITSCLTSEGDDGECVPYYLCNDNNIINVDGTGIIDIRAPGDCSYLDTCCKLGNRAIEPITPKPVTKSPILVSTPTPKPDINEKFPVIDKPEPRILRCGERNQNGVGHRIKGDLDNEAEFGEFPWMVAVLQEEQVVNNKSQQLNVYQCGGSLIHPKVVLTAAHCVSAKSKSGGEIKLKARAGEWDTQTKKELLPYQDRKVIKIIKHEHFYAGGLFNDIALLILDSPVEAAENVGLICLPPKNVEPELSRCFASGWGKDTFGKVGKYQVILKKIELPIVERSKCQKSLRKTRLGTHFELHKSFICAGGEVGKDTCKGDGGSPLVCPVPGIPGIYWQSGIVAWGIGCGENGTPGVYSHVSYLREWIDEQLISNSIDMKPYRL